MDKLLVIDDEYAIRLLFQEELTYEGYQVTAISNCEDLLNEIDRQKPDLIILDIKLGNVNGLDILQDIRNRHYDMPVILCTAYPTFKYDLKSIAADYYVVKSSSLDDLKAKIKMALESRFRFSKELTLEKVVQEDIRE